MSFDIVPGVLWLLLGLSGFYPTSLISFGSKSWWVVFGLATLASAAMMFVQWRVIKWLKKISDTQKRGPT